MTATTADIVSLQLRRRRRDRETLVEPVIAHWKCRVGICIAKCGVTQTAIDTLAMFNAELERRRERHIECDDVMVCEAHKDKLVKSRW